MKRIITFTLFFLLAIAGRAQDSLQCISRAKIAVENILKENYDLVHDQFDSLYATKMDTARLDRVWNNILKLTGKFKNYDSLRTSHERGHFCVIQRCAFEKTKVDIKCEFSIRSKISNLFFLPAEKPNQYKNPAY